MDRGPSGFRPTTRFPHTGVRGPDALKGLNPDGAVFSRQEYDDLHVAWYGRHWERTSDGTIINIIGISAADDIVARRFVDTVHAQVRQPSAATIDIGLQGARGWREPFGDGVQDLTAIVVARGNRAIYVNAVGLPGSDRALRAFAAEFAAEMEALPPRSREQATNRAWVVAAGGLALAAVAGAGVVVQRRRTRAAPVG